MAANLFCSRLKLGLPSPNKNEKIASKIFIFESLLAPDSKLLGVGGGRLGGSFRGLSGTIIPLRALFR